MTAMQFKECDIHRLVTACKVYQDQTGSEYMWDEYEHLIHKLHNYQNEIDCPDCIACDVHS